MTSRKQTPHVSPKEAVDISMAIVKNCEFAERCPTCVMAIISTLIGQYVFHAIEPKDRAQFISDTLQHAQDIQLGMEKHLEHKGVTH